MSSERDSTIKISSDSSLIQMRSLTMSGDYYRLVMGRKELVTYETLELPEFDEDIVLFTEERFAGESDYRYTVNKLKVVSFQQSNEDKDGESSPAYNQEFKSDFDFLEVGNYEMKGFVFNYQIVPTLNKGIKVTKSFVTPTHLFSVKGYLSDHVKRHGDTLERNQFDLWSYDKSPDNDATHSPYDPGDYGNTDPSFTRNGIPDSLKTNYIPNASSLRKTITQEMEHHISI